MKIGKNELISYEYKDPRVDSLNDCHILQAILFEQKANKCSCSFRETKFFLSNFRKPFILRSEFQVKGDDHKSGRL